MTKAQIIDKYIQRIMVDYPEADKIHIDLMQFAEELRQCNVSGSLPPVEAISFAKWLKHLDNGDVHYNPLNKAESSSIGFSPFDCFADDVYTVEELYKRWVELGRQ